MTAQPHESASPLPGLEAVDTTHRYVSPLETGVRRTLAALAARDLLLEDDAGKTATAIELAQVITKKVQTGRASTVSNDARLLVEILDSLKPEAAGGVDDELRATMEEWSRAAGLPAEP